MAFQGPLSSFTTALYTAVYWLIVHGCCQVHGCSPVSGNPRSGQKLGSYTVCNSTEKFLDPSQLEWLTGPLTTIFLPTIYSTVLFTGLPANALAIWILAVKIKKVPSTLFLLNLASADLFFILVLPFKISYHFLGNNWLFGEALCRMTSAFFYVNMYCSILFLTCISVDRYFSLVHPFKARGSRGWRKSFFISVAVWVLVVAVLIPFLLVPQTVTFTNPDITTCHDITAVCSEYDWLLYYMLSLVVIGFAIPFLIVVFCYGSIILKLISKRKNHSRVICLVFLVFVTFLLCFTPSNVLYIGYSINKSPERQNQLYRWYSLALALGSFNSSIDPFIYYFTSRDFRGVVKTMVCFQKQNNSLILGRTSEQLLQKKATVSSD
ncbi:proteinase-activated receptor 3-like isoform X1 [Lissotriton helveticus]